MHLQTKHLYFILVFIVLFTANACSKTIDRQAVVKRHNITTTAFDGKSPAQVGNGEFAFSMDITGLQTFQQFYTSAQWSWHSIPLPAGVSIEDY